MRFAPGACWKIHHRTAVKSKQRSRSTQGRTCSGGCPGHFRNTDHRGTLSDFGSTGKAKVTQISHPEHASDIFAHLVAVNHCALTQAWRVVVHLGECMSVMVFVSLNYGCFGVHTPRQLSRQVLCRLGATRPAPVETDDSGWVWGRRVGERGWRRWNDDVVDSKVLRGLGSCGGLKGDHYDSSDRKRARSHGDVV